MPPSATETILPPSETSKLDAERGPEGLLDACLELVEDDLALAELRLAELLRSSIAVIPEVAGHLTFAGGKRFRPLLTLLCARAAGFDHVARITVAAVGELLHTATLLHDDVIDGGEFRRGRPAARLAYGNGMAVLTGDYCLARSLQAIARLGSHRAVNSMSDTVTRMAEGEVAQLQIAGDFSLDRERYMMVIDRKTAALIAWCSAVGELVDPRYIDALQRFGHELGHAFQIADDVLDFQFGGGSVTGKNPAQDLREGKMTLPLILACESNQALRRKVERALRAGPPMSDDAVEEIGTAVIASQGPDRATEAALAHAGRALESLRTLRPSAARDALEAVTHYVVRRNH